MAVAPLRGLSPFHREPLLLACVQYLPLPLDPGESCANAGWGGRPKMQWVLLGLFAHLKAC